MESGALPQEQLDQAAVYEKVNAQLIRSEEIAKDYIVRAPWTGIVSVVIVREDEFVASRAPLLEMYDPAGLVIRAAVPEKYAAAICVGMVVDVEFDAYARKSFQAHIGRVHPYLDARLRTRTIEINPDSSVRVLPGMFSRLMVLLNLERDAVVVPVEAVVMKPKGAVVFIFDDGKAV